ncbi:MAG: glutamine--tRNA ligase/YqeY domain fusion protein [Planctomycetaceae bacterium]|jgi:glutaminyl-tRNA synthetase|nr:glutamine--tRNA ligase/YqeY domain fusion protein [Planctomycetaceae bacterium]
MSKEPANIKENYSENNNAEPEKRLNFIEQIIEDDLQTGKFGGRVHTRFPPEPNGYLHIGHAKSICLNSGLATRYNGNFNVRFDDTNPTKEDTEYVESIIEDVQWLTGRMFDHIYYASDYFEQFYAYAVDLIKKGKAYVCDLTPDEIRTTRGTPTIPGEESPYRNRSIEENLDLFARMRSGEFPDGQKTLRAKIDMASPNFNLRDPIMYRIVHAEHHRTGNRWCIYPMYDWAHGLEDSIERITHSICTLEFEHHRPLYDWFIDQLGIYHPQQIEFARLALNYTVMSKRKLLQLVKENYVNGWDDPRMPTICGLRRRGYTPEAIREFCRRIGIAKFNSTIDFVQLENSLRDDLNKRAQRRMAVLRPLKVVIDNYPAERTEWLDAVNNPENEADGTRRVPFSHVIYIEQDDFLEDAPKKYYRLAPGKEVRLRYAYYITCTSFVKDAAGNVTEVHCNYDPATRGGSSPDGRKVQGTIHWVSAEHAVDAEMRLYDRLFTKETPDDPQDSADFKTYLNPQSLEVLNGCKLEPALKDAAASERFQFERTGYFALDSRDSSVEHIVFNRAVSLRDSWAKQQGK